MCLVGEVPYKEANLLKILFVKPFLPYLEVLADHNLDIELVRLFLYFLLLCLWIFV
jgi:hypothetical protein